MDGLKSILVQRSLITTVAEATGANVNLRGTIQIQKILFKLKLDTFFLSELLPLLEFKKLEQSSFFSLF